MDIGTENIQVASFTGSHAVGKTDEDVTTIFFSNNTMFYFPYGIGAIFKNLKNLVVFDRFTTKLIKRSYFKNMEKLEDLRFRKTEIKVLPFDTLWDLPALDIFYFTYNKITIVDERTFEKNERLTSVSLMANHLEFLPRNLFKKNVLLENVYLSENSLKNIAIDFTVFKKIQRLFLGNNACIDALYTVYGNYNSRDNFEKLTEFQNQIRANCSSMTSTISV